jgi:hypothetical protein
MQLCVFSLWHGQRQLWYIISISVLIRNFVPEIFFQYLIVNIVTKLLTPSHCTTNITDLLLMVYSRAKKTIRNGECKWQKRHLHKHSKHVSHMKRCTNELKPFTKTIFRHYTRDNFFVLQMFKPVLLILLIFLFVHLVCKKGLISPTQIFKRGTKTSTDTHRLSSLHVKCWDCCVGHSAASNT